jgi:hypothetical protein
VRRQVGAPARYRLTTVRLVDGVVLEQDPMTVAPEHLPDVVRAEMQERHPLLCLTVEGLDAQGRPVPR